MPHKRFLDNIEFLLWEQPFEISLLLLELEVYNFGGQVLELGIFQRDDRFHEGAWELLKGLEDQPGVDSDGSQDAVV